MLTITYVVSVLPYQSGINEPNLKATSVLQATRLIQALAQVHKLNILRLERAHPNRDLTTKSSKVSANIIRNTGVETILNLLF
jgi:hypothetical protein